MGIDYWSTSRPESEEVHRCEYDCLDLQWSLNSLDRL